MTTSSMTTNGASPRAPEHLQKEEHAANHWLIDVDEQERLTGQTIELEDLLRPTYWSKNVDRLKPGDMLRVHKDGTIDCRLIVTWTGPHGVGVKIFGAIYGSELYAKLKAIETAQHAKDREALAASVAPGKGTAP